jgi:hypothetical protein
MRTETTRASDALYRRSLGFSEEFDFIEFPTRAFNALSAFFLGQNGKTVITMDDLCGLTFEQFSSIDGMGRKTGREVVEVLEEMGKHLASKRGPWGGGNSGIKCMPGCDCRKHTRYKR